MTATAAPVTPASPHTKPTVAAIVGVIIGLLTAGVAAFHSGHLPSSATVSGILSGGGITLGSVGAFILSHLGITKAQLVHDETVAKTELVRAEPLVAAAVAADPNLAEHVAALESSLDAKVTLAVAKLPAAVQPDVEAVVAKVKAQLAAGLTAAGLGAVATAISAPAPEVVTHDPAAAGQVA